MENQHRKIKGYRELSQKDIDLMNKIKEAGKSLLDLVEEVDDHLFEQLDDGDDVPVDAYDSVAYASRDIKSGVMFLVRAVAQPEDF